MSLTKVGSILDGRELLDGGQLVDVLNPATGAVAAQQVVCDDETVAAIAESSERAFRSEAWQTLRG